MSLGSTSRSRWVRGRSTGCIRNRSRRTPTIRVVLAKEAISTGWDCPRAEVLYSERPASDATHIAQVIGRMVRQPLAHRIATDDALNSGDVLSAPVRPGGADRHQGRAGRQGHRQRPEHGRRDGGAVTEGVRAERRAGCGGVRVRRVAAEHPDTGPVCQSVAAGADAGTPAGRWCRRRGTAGWGGCVC